MSSELNEMVHVGIQEVPVAGLLMSKGNKHCLVLFVKVMDVTTLTLK